jgi:hypothetical protein
MVQLGISMLLRTGSAPLAVSNDVKLRAIYEAVI